MATRLAATKSGTMLSGSLTRHAHCFVAENHARLSWGCGKARSRSASRSWKQSETIYFRTSTQKYRFRIWALLSEFGARCLRFRRTISSIAEPQAVWAAAPALVYTTCNRSRFTFRTTSTPTFRRQSDCVCSGEVESYTRYSSRSCSCLYQITTSFTQ